MYNEYVKLYCDSHNLEILSGVFKNYVVDGNTLIAEFKDCEKGIIFYNKNGSKKSVLKKGDLMLSLVEGEKIH